MGIMQMTNQPHKAVAWRMKADFSIVPVGKLEDKDVK